MSLYGKTEGSPVKDIAQSTALNYNQDAGMELTKAQARRLLLKTDLVVMPLAVLSMTLAFLDKVFSNV